MKNLVVVKIGGSTLGDHDTTLQDLVNLQNRGVPVVAVHGGASRVTEWLKRQNIPTSFLNGLRVTDERTLEMVAAVLGGLVNTELVAAINSLGGQAVGMTGVDGNLIESRIQNTSLGFAGRTVRVNPQAVQAMLDVGFMPLVAPPGARSSDETANVPYLNVNGDDIVGELVAALKAEKLIFLTDVEGIHDKEDRLLPELSADDAESLMASGVIDRGMIPKAEAALTALKQGCKVLIVDGRKPHALLNAVEGDVEGTVIR